MASTNSRAPRRCRDLAEHTEVASAAVGVANPANGDHTRPLVAATFELVVVHAAIVRGHAAASRRPKSRRCIQGYRFDGNSSSSVTTLSPECQDEPLGDQIDARRGAGDQRDFVGLAPINRAADSRASFTFFAHSGHTVSPSSAHSATHWAMAACGWPGNGGDCGVIQIRPLAGDRHFGSQPLARASTDLRLGVSGHRIDSSLRYDASYRMSSSRLPRTSLHEVFCLFPAYLGCVSLGRHRRQ